MPLPCRSCRWVSSQPSRSPGIGQGQDTQPERIPAQGATDGEHVLAELFLDVMHHPGIGRGGGGEHRDGVRQLRDEVRDAPVVGAEVVAPVRDAVGLVNHQQPGPADELGELVFPEGRVGEAFRRDQQDVHFIGGELLADGVPVQLVRGVDGHRPHPGPRRGGHLVAHERQERGHDQGGAGAAAAQQQGGDEVHGRLPPAGALHHQGPPAAVDQGLNGLELAVMELAPPGAPRAPAARPGPVPGSRMWCRRRATVLERRASVLVTGHCFSIPAPSDSHEAGTRYVHNPRRVRQRVRSGRRVRAAT